MNTIVMWSTLYKKQKIWAVLITCMLLLGSCQKQLDTNPLDKFSNDVFWNSENDVLLALTGLYRGEIQMNSLAEFSPTDWWSYHGLLYLEFASDNAYDRRGDNSAFNKLSDGTLTSSIDILGNYWNLSYRRIARANFFLENVDKAPLEEDKLNRFKAEARFIRACQYFYLSQYWGSVPLVTTTLTLEEANTVDKASKQAVVDFVFAELTEIAGQLPAYAALPASERGRTNKQTALAFMGRLQLAERQFEDAVKTYETIISANENIIDADYTSLFDGSNESSKEILFATQYLVDLAGNGMLQHNYPRGAGGWHLHCPLGDLVEAYAFNDGTPFSYNSSRYDPHDLTKDRDPRLGYSILTNGDTFKGMEYITHPDMTLSEDQLTTTKQATRTGYGLRKFNDENFSGNLQNSGIDVPIIRYAEVLLSYLEAKLENGDAIDRALLDQTINAVRGRTSVDMPPIIETNPTILREILRNERRIELAFEGLRYWDLLRWDVAKDVLKGDFYGAPYPGARNLRVKGNNPRDSHERWYVTSKNFRETTDRYWPIPQKEIDINPKLK